MSLRLLLKLSGVGWFLPLLLGAVALTWFTTSPAEPGYPLAAQVRASEAMMLAYPVLALGACVTSRRLHRSGILDRPMARPRAVVSGAGPGVLGGLTLATAAGLQLVAAGSLGSLSAGLLAVAASWVLFATVLGAVLGRLGPLRATAPLSVLIPYLLIGFPPALDPSWGRHLFGLTSGCCRIDQVLDPRMVGGTVACLTGLTLLALTLVWASKGRIWPGLAIGLSALGLLGWSTSMVDGLSYQATQPRQGQPSCTQVGPTQVCVWPEHEETLTNALPTARAVIDAAEDSGLALPTRFVETSTPTTWPTVRLRVRADLPDSVLGYSVASSITPDPSDACLQKLSTQPEGDGALMLDQVRPVTTAWLLDRAGIGPAPVGLEPDAEQLLQELSTLPDAGAGTLRKWQADLISCRLPHAPGE